MIVLECVLHATCMCIAGGRRVRACAGRYKCPCTCPYMCIGSCGCVTGWWAGGGTCSAYCTRVCVCMYVNIICVSLSLLNARVCVCVCMSMSVFVYVWCKCMSTSVYVYVWCNCMCVYFNILCLCTCVYVLIHNLIHRLICNAHNASRSSNARREQTAGCPYMSPYTCPYVCSYV